MSKNLDHEFDEFLKGHESEVVKAIENFPSRLQKTTFRYGRFTLPAYYKPHFVSSKQEHVIKRVSATLAQVINTATRLYFEEGHMAHFFRMSPEAAELIKIDPGYSKNVVFSRFDALLEGESFKIIEFNADAPAGAAYGDQLEEILLAEEPLRDFFQENQIKGSHRIQNILNTLLEVYEEFGGFETPQIAIVDWRHVRTLPEFEYLKAYFESKGYKTTIADPRELKYKGGKLYHKNMRVHLIYRRAIFDELVEHLDEVQDMITAYRERAVCMVNPLRARLASTKALLSILTNPEFDHFFTENENKIKREHLPWTRRIADAEDFYGRKKIYLIDFLKDEKETLVLKPAASMGGKDVTVGLETKDADWNATIDRAVKGDWVVQEYVNIPIMTVPIAINHKLDFAYKKYNFNAFISNGKYIGGGSRLSEESVINVARAGGMIPSVIAEYEVERFET